MKILGIETSCDETAAAVVEDGQKILSNVVISQIDIFAEYGGVIPEVAARSHLEVMMPVVEKALKDAECTWDDIDAIAVTHAPGLLGSLLIGTLTARTLAILHDKPLYAVHHLKSHIYANWLREEMPENVHPRPSCEDASKKSEARPITMGARERVEDGPFLAFPLLALVISGGHTQILYMLEHNKFEIIGTTRDDAVGECFDKVAKILGLPYPGGPSIAKAAKTGNPDKYKLPHPKIDGLDFSFSGLKTAVLRAVQKELNLPISHPSHDLKNHLTEQQVADFAASFEKTAIDILLEKLQEAKQQYPDAKSIVFAGGVSANQMLREEARRSVLSRSINGNGPFTERPSPATAGARERSEKAPSSAISFPEPKLSGDNGAMVAAAAYYEIKSGVHPTDPYKLNIYPRISIDTK